MALEAHWDAASLARVSELVTEVGTLDGTLALALPEQVERLAHELAAAMEYQFHHADRPNRAGRTDHDRTGTTDDPSRYRENYVHSIDTVEVHVFGLHAVVQMAGGAVWVEYHTDPHVITARNAPYLHFRLGSGDWVQVEAVAHPEWPGDDFVGRAIRDLNLVKALSAILGRVRIARWITGAPGSSVSVL